MRIWTTEWLVVDSRWTSPALNRARKDGGLRWPGANHRTMSWFAVPCESRRLLCLRFTRPPPFEKPSSSHSIYFKEASSKVGPLLTLLKSWISNSPPLVALQKSAPKPEDLKRIWKFLTHTWVSYFLAIPVLASLFVREYSCAVFSGLRRHSDFYLRLGDSAVRSARRDRQSNRHPLRCGRSRTRQLWAQQDDRQRRLSCRLRSHRYPLDAVRLALLSLLVLSI